MFCVKCGNKLADNSLFCPKCGNKISSQNNTNLNNNSINNNTNFKNNMNLDNNSNINNNFNNTNSQETQNYFNANQYNFNTNNATSISNNNNQYQNSQTTKKKFDFVNFISNKAVVSILCLVALFCVIVLFKNIFANSFSKTRTVMIYMVGSDLESENGIASSDLSALDYDKISSNNMKIVLIAGGTESWKNSYVDVNKTSIYEFTDEGFIEVDSRELDNMGAIENLEYFLDYVYNNYKSSKYDFIYWNHGGAVDGSEYDDIYSDNLKLTEMKKAFSESKFKGNNKLEVLSFRTCLNSTIEVANVYKDYADYLVASEEVTYGAPISSALAFLNNILPDDNGIEYGTKQIDTYKSTISTICNEGLSDNENFCVNSTYSIIDLSKIDKVNSSLESFSQDISKSLNKNYNDISKIRSNMSQYASDSLSYDMIDLFDLSNKLKKYSNNSKKLQNAIESAVVYNWTNNDYSHGLSIYFPYNDDAFLKKYSSISTSNSYSNLISNFYNLKTGSSTSAFSKFSTSDIKNKKTTKNKADIEIELTDEQVQNFAKASYLVFVDRGDGYYTYLYRGNTVELDGNKLKANIKGKMLRIADSDFPEESEWIRSYEYESTDEYTDVIGLLTLYSSYRKSLLASVKIRIDDEHPNGYIRSVSSTDTNSTSSLAAFSPVGLSIQDYNYIESFSSSYKILNEDGSYNENWTTNSNGVIEGKYFLTDHFKIIKEDFSSEYNYYAIVQIWDTSNNSYYSSAVKIEGE